MEVELAEGRFFAWVARNQVHAGGIKQFFLCREDPDLIAVAAANQGMVVGVLHLCPMRASQIKLGTTTGR